MQKLILTLLFSIGVFLSAYADEERTLPQMQYGLSGQYIPVQCGLSTDINIYVQAMGLRHIQYQLVEVLNQMVNELISYLHFLMKIKQNTLLW